MNQDEDGVHQAELERCGIERVASDVFPWSDHRHSNGRNARAAVKWNAK